MAQGRPGRMNAEMNFGSCIGFSPKPRSLTTQEFAAKAAPTIKMVSAGGVLAPNFPPLMAQGSQRSRSGRMDAETNFGLRIGFSAARIQL
jgi:hypothetical protein